MAPPPLIEPGSGETRHATQPLVRVCAMFFYGKRVVILVDLCMSVWPSISCYLVCCVRLCVVRALCAGLAFFRDLWLPALMYELCYSVGHAV